MNDSYDDPLAGAHLDTLAVRAGIDRTHEGEHSEPIFATSSYVFGSAAEAAARVLVMPLGLYLQENPEGLHYVRILSQLAALDSPHSNPAAQGRYSFRAVPALESLMQEAMAHLGKAEARRRVFLVLTINFHGVADLYRSFAAEGSRQQLAMLEQVVCAITALLEAPARD